MTYSRVRPSGHWLDYPDTTYGVVAGADLESWDQSIYELKTARFYAGSTEFSTLQSAIDACHAAGGGIVDGAGRTFTVSSTVELKSSVELANMTIALANSANVDVVKTTNFDTLVGTNTNSDAGSFFTLRKVVIDGNKTNNASGRGLCIYGRKFFLNDVEVRNAAGRGIHSEWYTGGDEMEAHVSGLRVVSCGSDNIYWNGPHDSSLINLHSEKSAGRGIWVGPAANGCQFALTHSWGNTGEAIYSEAAPVLWDSTQGEGSPAGTYQVVLLGSGTRYTGRIFGSGVGTEHGLQIGDGSHSPIGLFVESEFVSLGGNWINFSSDGGRSWVAAVGTLGAGTRFVGLPSNRTVLSFSTENTDAGDFFWHHNLVFGDARSSKLNQNGGIDLLTTAGTGYIQFRKQSPTPSAPGSSDRAFLFAIDNGAGKGQLCVRFPTGAVQVIATEP